MKRIAIVGSVGVPANYGGFETLTQNLVEQLADSNEITVFCSGKAYAKSERKKSYKGAKLKYVPLSANGLSSVLYDYISILWSLFCADTILILGVSGCTLLPIIRLFTRKKIIVNIDGLEWRRKKWNKIARWFLRLSEMFAVRFAHAHVADNKAIQRYTAMYYGSIGHVIAYGGNHNRDTSRDCEFLAKYSFLQESYYVKVARIEPENNVEMVLKSFAQTDHRLVVVGNWQNSAYGKRLFNAYSKHTNILLLNPIYESAEIDFIRSFATAYIHGHEAGGTNPSLVEAMCLGVPVYAFDVSFNRETTKSSAVYFKSSEDLIERLNNTNEAGLRMNWTNMKSLARRHYQWEYIADRYNELIEGIYTESVRTAKVERMDRFNRLRLRNGGFEKMVRTHGMKF